MMDERLTEDASRIFYKSSFRSWKTQTRRHTYPSDSTRCIAHAPRAAGTARRFVVPLMSSSSALARGGVARVAAARPRRASSRAPASSRRATTTSAISKNDADAAPPPSRRDVLLAAAATAATLASSAPSPARADAPTSVVAFEGVANERWTKVPVAVSLPSAWQSRPGQRAKQTKFMMYTDTYGPNYRYTDALPKFVDADGGVVADFIACSVQSRGGQESVTDLGPIGNVDAKVAFGVDVEDIALAETAGSNVRKDAGKQTYYEWDLDVPNGSKVLLSACISGGGLYVLSIAASEAQWKRAGEELKRTRASFAVPVAAESTTDISNRIYNNASAGGFK